MGCQSGERERGEREEPEECLYASMQATHPTPPTIPDFGMETHPLRKRCKSVSLPASLLQEVPDVVDLLRLQHAQSSKAHAHHGHRAQSVQPSRQAAPKSQPSTRYISNSRATARKRFQGVGALSTHIRDTSSTAHVHLRPPSLDRGLHTGTHISLLWSKVWTTHTNRSRSFAALTLLKAPPFANALFVGKTAG